MSQRPSSPFGTTATATAQWQLSLPCTRAEGEALDAEDSALADAGESMLAILHSEPDPARPDDWRIDIIFGAKPSADQLAALLARLPSSDRAAMTLAPVPDIDWVTRSQDGLEPVTAGRFHVRHHAEEALAPGMANFLIPASRAFGTGSHETTAGCLLMLERLRRRGHRFGNIADIGTGTGLLAFAALALWPRAHVLASDIDPVAIDVTAENATLNDITLGADRGKLALLTAPGVDHALFMGLAPFDLVIANILAGPLVELAPSLSAQLAEGGSLILAGLIESQVGSVLAAYRGHGMRLAERIGNGAWPTLHLRKRRRFGWRRPERWRAEDDGATNDFGSW